MNTAMIIETRNIPKLQTIIESHLKMLPSDWKCIVYCGRTNIKTVNSKIPVEFRKLHNNNPDINKLLTDKSFLIDIGVDKLLMFQHDTDILSTNIRDFEEWDYVGAPWSWANDAPGGNGGLSVRSIKAMLDTIENVSYDSTEINEDVYYSRNLIGKIAPRSVCDKFSCESVFALNTYGYHAIERYLTHSQCEQIKNQKINLVRITYSL